MQEVARGCLCVMGVVLLTGCAQPAAEVSRDDAVHDPFEAQNRKVHAFNKKVFGKVGGGTYARVVPTEIQDSIHNVADTLSMPQVAVNSLLQGDLRGTGIASYRFLVNATLGIGGIADVASEFGVEEHDTDFGETLHVWGAGEGAYLELPLLGPSTQRDAAGRVVDLFTDPLGYVLEEPDKYAPTAIKLVDKLGKGSRRSEAIGDVLNNSADSYAQARLIYLQNRRYELRGGSTDLPEYEDPYAQ